MSNASQAHTFPRRAGDNARRRGEAETSRVSRAGDCGGQSNQKVHGNRVERVETARAAEGRGAEVAGEEVTSQSSE